jgi:hypothetical protein
VVLRLPPGHVHSYGFLLAHFEKALFPLALPGTGELTEQPHAWPSGAAPEGPDTARFTKALESKKRPTRRLAVGAGAAPPPNPPPRPASGSPRFPNTLGQVGEQYGPSIAPFARARCPFSPTFKATFSRRGSARVARGPIFVFRTPQLFHSVHIGHT